MGREFVVDQPVYFGLLVSDGVDQLHHHDHQYARSGYDLGSFAPDDLGAVCRGHFVAPGPAGVDLRAGDDVFRPHDGHALLPARRRG